MDPTYHVGPTHDQVWPKTQSPMKNDFWSILSLYMLIRIIGFHHIIIQLFLLNKESLNNHKWDNKDKIEDARFTIERSSRSNQIYSKSNRFLSFIK